MTLIQRCLSNSPSHRPTSSEVYQRVSAVAADHPPSFNNRMEMMDRIKALSEEKERVLLESDATVAEKNGEITEVRREKDTATGENESVSAELEETQSTKERLCQLHSIEVETLQTAVTDFIADNEYLQATFSAKEKAIKSEQQMMLQRYEKQLETMRKEKQAMEEQYQSIIIEG